MNERTQVLRERDIKKVVHFHTDHFEPGPEVGIRQVETWLKLREQQPFACKASVFYLANFLTADDQFEFQPHALLQEDGQILLAMESAGADLHVHVHHEQWTSGRHSGLAIDPERDAERLDQYLSFLLPYLYPTQRPRWGFIHGKWALNASDPDVCFITDEIRILMKHGCVGDFSFPAGRRYCDPVIKRPFSIKAVNRSRSYDHAEADPRPISHQMDSGRFLVWNAEAPFETLSLEHVATDVLPAVTLDAWLGRCPVINGVLYVRTFAHSLNEEFWRGDLPTPLFSPSVARVFDLLAEVCASIGIPLRYCTATEVIDALVRI